jgi:hypothetical protein
MANGHPLNWAHYIKETLFVAWENNTPVDLTSYSFLFEHHFDLKKTTAFLRRQALLRDDAQNVFLPVLSRSQ